MKVLPPLYLSPYSFISRTSSFLSEIDGLVSLELLLSVRYWDSKGNRKIIESAQNTFLLTLSPRERHIFTAGDSDGTRTHDNLRDSQAHWPLCYGTIWQAVLISRDESLRLSSFACFPKENIPRRYQSFAEFHFLFATNTLKSINKYPAKGLAEGQRIELWDPLRPTLFKSVWCANHRTLHIGLPYWI